MYAWCPWRPEEGVGSPRTIVTNGSEIPCVWKEPNPSAKTKTKSDFKH